MAFFQIAEILILKEIKAYGLYFILDLLVLFLCQLFITGKLIVKQQDQLTKVSQGLYGLSTIILTEVALRQDIVPMIIVMWTT